MSGDHILNTEKISGDLRRLSVPQTPVGVFPWCNG